MISMKSMKIMSIYERLYLRKAKFMFKIYNNVAPTYISENFTLKTMQTLDQLLQDVLSHLSLGLNILSIV